MLGNGIAKDAEFLKAIAESEKEGKLAVDIESVLMVATDYSPIKSTALRHNGTKSTRSSRCSFHLPPQSSFPALNADYKKFNGRLVVFRRFC